MEALTPNTSHRKLSADGLHRHKFIIELARCFLAFGAPTHRLDTQLTKAVQTLAVKAEFVLLPNTVFISFPSEEEGGHGSGLHIVKRIGSISLHQLRATHQVYKEVVSLQRTAEEGWRALAIIQQTPQPYSKLTRCLIAFLCGAVITLLAFDGSFLDAMSSGVASCLLAVLNFHMTEYEPSIARISELLGTFVISFVARGLYSVTNHRVCFSAVSSGGIVLILPGFAVMSAALELSNKTMLTGSLKLVWGMFQALFIGFVQTLGSDLWLSLDRSARDGRLAMMADITSVIYTEGMLSTNWTSGYSTDAIALSFAHTLDPNTAYDKWNYISVGCYRSAHWPWYMQGLKWWWSLPLVPMFAFLLALWNLQPLRTRTDVKHVSIMLLLGCASYAGNLAGSTYVHGSVGSVLGAFAVSLLGTIYGRVWNGYAFAVMVPGVLLLVPSGLTAAGGLAQNYSISSDQFTSGLQTGLAMVQVSIALTVGLCLAVAGCHVCLTVKQWILREEQDLTNIMTF